MRLKLAQLFAREIVGVDGAVRDVYGNTRLKMGGIPAVEMHRQKLELFAVYFSPKVFRSTFRPLVEEEDARSPAASGYRN